MSKNNKKKYKNNTRYGHRNFRHGIPFLCVCLHQLSFSLQNIMILNLERAPFKIHRHCLHAKMRQKLFPLYSGSSHSVENWTKENFNSALYRGPHYVNTQYYRASHNVVLANLHCKAKPHYIKAALCEDLLYCRTTQTDGR